MITICEPIETVEKIIKKTKIRNDIDYRLSDHCVTLTVEEGTLLYHTLTCELLLVNDEEGENLKRFRGRVPEHLKSLVLRRILVPEDEDEQTYCDQLRRIIGLLSPKEDAVTSYSIFTTTDCNARCFYCFEKGRSRISMSEATAQASADYIAEHCKGKPVHLAWFGGEPLFNAAAIETIIQRLHEKGVEYTSSMISNGYLFDEALVNKAKSEWKLNRIQITLDGTEEVYNRRKAYIYREGSAYRRVLRNIELLLEAGISVDIRLNLDMRNQEELHALVTELASIFVNENKPAVYNHILFETPREHRSEEKRKELYRASAALTAHITRCGLGRQDSVPHRFKVNHCMADNDSVVTITPEGRLGKCDFCSEGEEMFGDIRKEEKDNAVIESWKKTYPALPECKTCFYYPQCFRLLKCPTQRDYCDRELREQLKNTLRTQMRNTFKNQNKQTEKEQIDIIEC